MNDTQIKDLIDIFKEKYPLEISNIADFRRQARFIPREFSVSYFEQIIDGYIKYSDAMNTFYEFPEVFIRDKWYLDDYNVKLNNINKNRYRNTGDLWFSNYEDMTDHFDIHLKKHFENNYSFYGRYISDAKHLIKVKPCYQYDKQRAQYKLHDNKCNYEIHSQCIEKEEFNKLTELKKNELLLQIELGKIDVLDLLVSDAQKDMELKHYRRLQDDLYNLRIMIQAENDKKFIRNLIQF